MDKKSWTEVLEYAIAAVAAAWLAIMLSESFTTPLWGGLTSLPLR